MTPIFDGLWTFRPPFMIHPFAEPWIFGVPIWKPLKRRASKATCVGCEHLWTVMKLVHLTNAILW